MKELTVYRTSAMETTKPAAPSKPLYGILRQAPNHKCEPPGMWARLFRWLAPGDLYRCHCGQVWRLHKPGWHLLLLDWEEVGSVEWRLAGGGGIEEEPKDD